MALHINLYHEVQKQELARRRDPLKLGMLGLLIIGVGFVAYYFFRLERMHAINVRIAALEADWQRFDPKQKAARAREDELNADVKTYELLTKRIESRFYWAPLLQEVLENVPHEVQFTKVSGDLPLDGGKSSVLTVTGISSSEVPRKVAEDLRTALHEKLSESFKKVEAHFVSLDDSEETVLLDSKKAPTANFTIEFRLNNNVDPAPVPAPVANRKKVAAE